MTKLWMSQVWKRAEAHARGRRLGFAGATAAWVAALAAPAWAIPQGDKTVALQPIASGLVSPVYLTHAGDGSGRLFVVDQAGMIRIIKNGALLPTPFLDLTATIVPLNAAYDERGLLGLTFHPDYVNNGRFFVRYSAPREGAPEEPCADTNGFIVGCHAEVLAEYQVSNDPDVADANSGTILFTIDKPQFNHNAGQVAFGPDGYLYFSLGDGGGANDGLADVPPSHGPDGYGQNLDAALGKMLRIDVDGAPPYAIPPSNPFVGVAGLDEIYAYGFRNPYRWSFDDGPGGTGRLFVADVGQDLFEELNLVTSGGNYGWVIREAAHCFDPFDPGTPPASCDSNGMTDPIVEYAHADGGLAVVGGFVYRGTRSPGLVGTFATGDFSADFGPTGRLYYVSETSPGVFDLRQFQLGRDNHALGQYLKGYGEGGDGELYVLTSSVLGPSGTGGEVSRMIGIEPRFGDGDADGDVDLADWSQFQGCMSGPGVPYDFDGTTSVTVLVGSPFNQFSPANPTIEVGDTIHWDWVNGLHNVESGLGGTHDGNFRSGNATSNTSTVFDVTFNQAFLTAHPMPNNLYPYYCVIHFAMGMTGSVQVNADPCAKFDQNVDGDVDMQDAAAFQNNFTGAL